MIDATRLSNEYDGKPATLTGSALSNFLTTPGNTGLGDKQARFDYGFPYLFDGLVNLKLSKRAVFIVPLKQTSRFEAANFSPALTKADLTRRSTMAQSNILHPAQSGQTLATPLSIQINVVNPLRRQLKESQAAFDRLLCDSRPADLDTHHEAHQAIEADLRWAIERYQDALNAGELQRLGAEVVSEVEAMLAGGISNV